MMASAAGGGGGSVSAGCTHREVAGDDLADDDNETPEDILLLEACVSKRISRCSCLAGDGVAQAEATRRVGPVIERGSRPWTILKAKRTSYEQERSDKVHALHIALESSETGSAALFWEVTDEA